MCYDVAFTAKIKSDNPNRHLWRVPLLGQAVPLSPVPHLETKTAEIFLFFVFSFILF